nr:MAG TPA: hypothetical protein [Caudoviricetes sp.]
MKFVEAVNWVEKKYGAQAFDHLEDYAEDEAAQMILREQKKGHTKQKKKYARGKDPGPKVFRKMVEDGYSYVDIVAATGLGITTVQVKVKKYGLREFYHKMHPEVRRSDVKVLCINHTTGEQREYETMASAERALGLYRCTLSQNMKNGKTFVHGDWEIRRKQ